MKNLKVYLGSLAVSKRVKAGVLALLIATFGAGAAKANSKEVADMLKERGISFSQRDNEYANYILNLDSIVEGDVEVEKESIVNKPTVAKLNGYHNMLGVIANYNIKQAFENPKNNDHISYGAYIDETEFNADELALIKSIDKMTKKYIAHPTSERLTKILDTIQYGNFSVSGKKAVEGFLVEIKAVTEFYGFNVKDDNYDVERLVQMEYSYGGNSDIITYDTATKKIVCH